MAQQTASDQDMIAILSSMVDSSAPTIIIITNQVIQVITWSWQSRNSDSRLKGLQPPRHQKHTCIRQKVPKPSGIDFLCWKPDEPNAKGHYKSWGSTQRSLCAPTVYNTGWDHIIHVVQFDREFQTTLDQISRLALACSKCSDSGERCKVKKAMKSTGTLSHLSPSLAFIFLRSFLLHTATHYLNAWNRLA